MSSNEITFSRIALLLSATLVWTTPARADIVLSPSTNGGDFEGTNVCGILGGLYFSGDSGECEVDDSVVPDTMTFESGTELKTLAGSIANFGGPVNFSSSNVQFSSATVAFGGGSATFNNTVSFTGPSVTFGNPVTFNGLTGFNAGVTTTNLTNTGGILTGTINASTGISASSGANVNMGNNIIHGVAAGVAATDAVNVAQLIGATSGITADISALETVTDTHTTQIANLETTTVTHTTQIATLQTDLTAETATRITADAALQTNIDAEAATRAAADTALQTNVAGLQTDIDTLFDLRSRDRREARRGTAAAVAMSEAPMPSRDGGIAYSLHGATYRGQYALGGSLKYRINRAVALDVGLSHAGHKDTAARVGISGEF
jgi:hypothetical protein